MILDDLVTSFEAQSWKIVGSLMVLLIAFILYKVTVKGIRLAIISSHGRDEDVQMVVNAWRIIMGFLAPMVAVAIFFPEYWVLPTFMGAFGGLFLGWALQPVVTSVAVWLLVTMKRPFKLGDRIQIPTLGLKGDVIEVGPMYTILNQVGGSIESEEAVNRTILIPNTVLFSNPTVNFTPDLMQTSAGRKKRLEAYSLDEVIARITYDTDWIEAERIMKKAANEVTAEIIKATRVEPYVRSDMYDYGVYLRLRYMTLATDRPRIKYEIEKRIFNDFQKTDGVDFAIPYVYSAKSEARRITDEG